MNGLTLKHLRYFDALARHGQFGRAAEACAISQPALSVQMKELEELIGAPLIERGARQVRLTGLGEAFVERTRDILRALEELGDLVRASSGTLLGRLRIGVIPTIAPYILPRVIKQLQARFPDLDLRPREAVTQRLVDDLAAGTLDAAILALPISDPSLHKQPLFTEEFVLVRSSEDSGKPVPDPETLRQMRLLLLEEGHCFRDQALTYCDLTSSAPRELMEGSSLTTLVQMVGAGIGVTLLPEMAVSIETRSAPVAVARLAEPRPARTIGLVWRRANPLTEQLMQVADIVRQAGTEAARASEHAQDRMHCDLVDAAGFTAA